MKAKEYLRDLKNNNFSGESIGEVINSLVMEVREQYMRSKEPNDERTIAMIDTIQDKWRSISLKSDGRAPINYLMFYILAIVFKMDTMVIKLWRSKTRHTYLFEDKNIKIILEQVDHTERLKDIIRHAAALAGLELLNAIGENEHKGSIINNQGEYDDSEPY